MNEVNFTIQISKETKKILDSLIKKNQTYNDLIMEIINELSKLGRIIK